MYACVACACSGGMWAGGQVGMWHNSLMTPKITAYVACGCVASCGMSMMCALCATCHVCHNMCAHVCAHVCVRVPCVHVRVCHDAPSFDVCGKMCTWHMRACVCVCAGGIARVHMACSMCVCGIICVCAMRHLGIWACAMCVCGKCHVHSSRVMWMRMCECACAGGMWHVA
jgi:hypothetical protein